MKIQRTLATFAVPVLLALGSTVSQAAGADARVTQLIKQSGAALHTSAMRTIHVIHLKQKAVAAGIAGSADSWNEMGGVRSAQTYSNPPLAGANGWDGTSNWNEDQAGLVWVDGSDSGRSQAISTAFLTNYDLWKPHFGGATVTWAGSQSDKGKTYEVLTVVAPGSLLPFDLWFDRGTHLPERMVQVTGPLTGTIVLSDYRSVHGLMVPYSINSATSDGNSSTSTVTQADVNPSDGNARLAKPASTVHDFSFVNGVTQTTIPIQLSENHVYLSLMLNGKGPYHFIYDTGGANIVDPAVAKEIGAFGTGGIQGGGVGSATESVSFATVNTMQIGDAVVKNQVFGVAPVRQGFGVSAGQPVDGLIGFEVLSRFITTFDYANNQVILQMPGTYTAPAGAEVIPIVQNGQQPQFACTIENVPAECTVDTGARDSISLFAPFMTAHPQVVPTTLSANGVNGFGFGGAALGKLGRMQNLGFGSFMLHNVIGDYTTQTQGAFAVPFVGANVGGGVWKRFTMTLDYNKLTMTLTPNATLDSPDTFDRSGLFLINHGGVVTIAGARDGTPAVTAGLAKGDAILSVDGTSTASLTLQAIRDTFSGTAGTPVHLVIKGKDGTTREVTLTLADYV
jgi:hypothetical protein